jgi:type IV secretory pathway VirB2 component (pilin)
MNTSPLDPSDHDAIGSSVSWLETAFSALFAMTVAITAIGSVGLLLLTGRIDFRRWCSAAS